jgi:quinol monooxygenase YgiN
MPDNNNIHLRAEVIIEEGKKEEYKKLIQDMSRAVEANEPDTINYRFYLNKPETECIVWETYTNSEAVLVHINGVASQTILPKVHSVSRISKLDVYGNPSKELQKVLTGTLTFNPFAGFSR